MRVVPNLFPALEGPLGRQEVVVHAPRHATSIADLEAEDLAAVARAWRERARAAAEDGFAYLHALVNEGRAAGSSLPHGHSQLVAFPAPPPAVTDELAAGAGEPCRVCALLDDERRDGSRLVADADGVVALCPPAARAPYELAIAPVSCQRDAFTSSLLPGALGLAGELVRRLHRLEGRAPLNAWLRTAPFAGPPLHWRLELVPRLTALAGIELGAGVWINPLAPEAAASAFRAAA